LARQMSLFHNCVQCSQCTEYYNCGGCHSTCQYESCLMSCSNCASICCVHPHITRYLSDIQGTDFPNFHSFQINHIKLPRIIPLLTDSWDAEKPYPLKWVAIGINLIYGQRGIKINFLRNLHKRLRLPEKTNIILINHGYDCYIENFWCNAHYKKYIGVLASSNIKLATGFNYSLFDIHSRMSHLISLKKTLITTKDLLNSGLNTIPHLYWKTKRDILRWITFLRKYKIYMASLNFTYKKDRKSFKKAVDDITLISDSINKDIQWLVVGVSKFNKVKYLSEKLGRFNIVSAKIHRAAKSRRILTYKGEKHIPELTQYEAFRHNYNFLKMHFKRDLNVVEDMGIDVHRSFSQ
jgi:hypothetical protein